MVNSVSMLLFSFFRSSLKLLFHLLPVKYESSVFHMVSQFFSSATFEPPNPSGISPQGPPPARGRAAPGAARRRHRPSSSVARRAPGWRSAARRPTRDTTTPGVPSRLGRRLRGRSSRKFDVPRKICCSRL